MIFFSSNESSGQYTPYQLHNIVDRFGAGDSFCAGLLFALNRLLAHYRGAAQESESARESRRLLAEQAHGVSEILRDIAAFDTDSSTPLEALMFLSEIKKRLGE